MTNSSGHTEMAKANALCVTAALSQPPWDTPAQTEAGRVSWAELNVSSSAVWAHMSTRAEWSQGEWKPRKHETKCLCPVTSEPAACAPVTRISPGSTWILTPAELRLQLHSDVIQPPPSWNQTPSMQEFNSLTTFRRESKCLFWKLIEVHSMKQQGGNQHKKFLTVASQPFLN